MVAVAAGVVRSVTSIGSGSGEASVKLGLSGGLEEVVVLEDGE